MQLSDAALRLNNGWVLSDPKAVTKISGLKKLHSLDQEQIVQHPAWSCFLLSELPFRPKCDLNHCNIIYVTRHEPLGLLHLYRRPRINQPNACNRLQLVGKTLKLVVSRFNTSLYRDFKATGGTTAENCTKDLLSENCTKDLLVGGHLLASAHDRSSEDSASSNMV